ncbi:hypothetical protein POUND7_006363 [Theobroma cacao]
MEFREAARILPQVLKADYLEEIEEDGQSSLFVKFHGVLPEISIQLEAMRKDKDASLLGQTLDWGPRPFRFLNCWLSVPSFMDMVSETWTSTEVNGSASFCLKVKMNKLKTHLKHWNRVSFGNVDNTITELENKVKDFDLIGNLCDLTEEECTAKRNTVQLLWTTSSQRESLWRQKSRIKWLKKGDKNTRFFQCKAKAQSRHNHITGIIVNGSWLSHPHEVRWATFEYFKDLFDCDQWAQPVFPSL